MVYTFSKDEIYVPGVHESVVQDTVPATHLQVLQSFAVVGNVLPAA